MWSVAQRLSAVVQIVNLILGNPWQAFHRLFLRAITISQGRRSHHPRAFAFPRTRKPPRTAARPRHLQPSLPPRWIERALSEIAPEADPALNLSEFAPPDHR